jgi:TRAP-type C4-dicarboxylate transport system substrate-binding protein
MKSRSANHTIELVFHNIHDHGTDIGDMWMAEIEKRSGGKVVFHATIGDNPDLISAADIVRDVPASAEHYPLLNLVQLPLTFPNSTVGNKVIAQLYEEFQELRVELSDVKVLGIGTGAPMAIFSSFAYKKILTSDDLVGTRIRSISIMDDIFRTFNAIPQHAGWFDMGNLLKSGELDAALLGIIPAYMFKLADDAAPYCTITGEKSITMHPMRIYMKWNTWNRLPDNTQDVFNELGPSGANCWYAVQNGNDSDAHMIKALDYFRQKGEITSITPDELAGWERIIQPVIDSMLDQYEQKGLRARRFVARLKELVDLYLK